MNIVLVGNQNSGKTTLFNKLTGTNQKVANYPGATIDFKEGSILKTNIKLIDLPGIISLSPHSPEQEITLSYILNEKVDLIVNVVDITSLERNLYLTTQLLDLDIPIIVALNMSDKLKHQTSQIFTKTLEKRFGVSFLNISATKNIGITELICKITTNDYLSGKRPPIYPSPVEQEINLISSSLDVLHKRYYALKLLEDTNPSTSEIISSQNKLKSMYDEDLYEVFAEQRYNLISKLISMASISISKYELRTEKIDKILLNKYLAIPIFLIIMLVIYSVSVGFIGTLSIDLISKLIQSFSSYLNNTLTDLGASPWSRSLLIDGVISGAGVMISFVPQLIVLFLFINILESSGYMTRIAFLFDKLFRKFGLSGRALIPFILGSGCSVPAIYSTKTIENKQERDLTIMLTPMVPCSAKLPLITLFASMFFKTNSGFIVFVLYLLAIIVIILSAMIIKYLFKITPSSGFLSELPSYKLPNLKYLIKDVVGQTWDFIKNATTIIVLSSVIVWVLISFNFNFVYGVPIEESILAYIGKFIAYTFYPLLGELSWASSVSALQGLIAKEQVVSSMQVIAGVSGSSDIFTSQMFSFFTTSSAISFMVFNLFSAPCIASITAMRTELGSFKKVTFAVLFQTLFAYVLAVVIFNILSLGGL
ncbi:MAG: ferrous iron transport protein B [Acholeplasmataceae bacterium]|nr:ferrous iron transport protein B [Acholeplasmataceae bacterium]